MFSRAVPVVLLAVGSLFLAGCGPGKLDVSKTYDLDSGEAQAIDCPAVGKPQTIKADFTSSECDVNVFLFKEEDAKASDPDSILTAQSSKALAKASGKSGSLSAEVPENTATRVVVRGASKKTKVDVKVTNQK
jgi:hypothetical protein